jgi:hypothetical protein
MMERSELKGKAMDMCGWCEDNDWKETLQCINLLNYMFKGIQTPPKKTPARGPPTTHAISPTVRARLTP